MLITAPKDVAPRSVDDYFQQLSAIYSKVQLESGNTPLQATTPADGTTPLYSDGLASVLPTVESLVTYTARNSGTSTPGQLLYPSNLLLYLDPEDTNIPDTGNQLPIHQASALTPDNPVTAASPQTIMAGTDDREWLLLDVNGTGGQNDLGISGDRVLLMVDDSTGRVLTAWQKCWMLTNPIPPDDATYHGIPYGSGTTCVMSGTAPTRTYYKSFFDVFKNYTGAY